MVILKPTISYLISSSTISVVLTRTFFLPPSPPLFLTRGRFRPRELEENNVKLSAILAISCWLKMKWGYKGLGRSSSRTLLNRWTVASDIAYKQTTVK